LLLLECVVQSTAAEFVEGFAGQFVTGPFGPTVSKLAFFSRFTPGSHGALTGSERAWLPVCRDELVLAVLIRASNRNAARPTAAVVIVFLPFMFPLSQMDGLLVG